MAFMFSSDLNTPQTHSRHVTVDPQAEWCCKPPQGQAAHAWSFCLGFAALGTSSPCSLCESTVLADKCMLDDASSLNCYRVNRQPRFQNNSWSSVFGQTAAKMGIWVYCNLCQSAYKKVCFHLQRLRQNLQLLLGFFFPRPRACFPMS